MLRALPSVTGNRRLHALLLFSILSPLDWLLMFEVNSRVAKFAADGAEALLQAGLAELRKDSELPEALSTLQVPLFKASHIGRTSWPEDVHELTERSSDLAQVYKKGADSLGLTEVDGGDGTAYMVGNELAATAAHCVSVDGCIQQRLSIRLSDATQRLARVVAVAPNEDLAILHVPDSSMVPALTLRDWGLPDGLIYGLGYPFHPRHTAIVSAATGEYGDVNLVQKLFKNGYLSPHLTASAYLPVPIEHGFSGGPFMTRDGTVWGTITNLHPTDPLQSIGTISNHLTAMLKELSASAELPDNGWIEFMTNATHNPNAGQSNLYSIEVTKQLIVEARQYPWLGGTKTP